MRIYLMSLALIGAVACAKAAAVPTAKDASVDANARLDRAHADYLKRDFGGMATSIRDILADGTADEFTRRNALELLQQAYTESSGEIPVNWQLPAGVSDMKVTQARVMRPNGVFFKLELRAAITTDDLVSQAQIVRFPDQVVLDRQGGLGEWSTTTEEEGFSFDLESEGVGEPMPEGLYLINLELKDGTRTSGWFVLSGVTSTASPVVNSPAVGETFTTANPTLNWDDFRSPQYQAHERRTINVHVSQITSQAPGWREAWGVYQQDPTATETTIGVDPLGRGDSKLEAGEYWLNITYLETHMFGPIKLRRASRVARSFYVRLD